MTANTVLRAVVIFVLTLSAPLILMYIATRNLYNKTKDRSNDSRA